MRAARLARIDVAACRAAVRPCNVGKCFLIGHVVGIDAIAYQRTWIALKVSRRLQELQRPPATARARYRSRHRRRGGHWGIRQRHQPEAPSRCASLRSRRNPSVQAQQIGHGSGRSTGSGDRRRVLTSGSRSVRGGAGMAIPKAAFRTRASSGIEIESWRIANRSPAGSCSRNLSSRCR